MPPVSTAGSAGERRTIAALSTTPDAAQVAAGPAPPGTGHVARNTAIFSAGTGISRVAGLAREIVAASYFGTTAAASAFTIAYLVPNLVANLFANAVLSAAFVPVFTDLLQKDRREEAVRLARTRMHVSLRFSCDWRDPRVKQVFTLMLPIMIGLGIVNLDLLINSLFGTLASDEAPRAIDNAFRLYMLPQGLFSVAVATVLFPTLSRMASRRDVHSMRRAVGVGMRQINLLLIPAATFMLVLTTPIVRLVYQRGSFTAHSTHLASVALFWFAFSLPFGGLNLLLTRTFFAAQRPWIPTRLAVINIVVDIIVSIALYKPLGIAGLVIGTLAANV